MSNQTKINVARALAQQLHTTEEAIETALAEAAYLIETYVNSRRAIRLSTVAVNDIYQNTLEAMQALNTAQTHMTDAHNALVRLQARIGLNDTVVVPIDDKPDPDSPGNTTPSGRLVTASMEE